MSENKTHVIDGVNYVEVDREAEVGELIVCTKHCEQNGRYYRPGDIGTMLYKSDKYPSIRVEFNEGHRGIAKECYVGIECYRVLEPLESDETPTPVIHDLLANLARRVSSLESQLRDTQGNVEKLAEELATHTQSVKKIEVLLDGKLIAETVLKGVGLR